MSANTVFRPGKRMRASARLRAARARTENAGGEQYALTVEAASGSVTHIAWSENKSGIQIPMLSLRAPLPPPSFKAN